MAPYTGRPAHAEPLLRPEPAPIAGIILLVNNQAAVGAAGESGYRDLQGISGNFREKIAALSNIRGLALRAGNFPTGSCPEQGISAKQRNPVTSVY